MQEITMMKHLKSLVSYGNLISQVTMLKKVSNIKPKKELDTVLVEGAMMDVLEDKSEVEK